MSTTDPDVILGIKQACIAAGLTDEAFKSLVGFNRGIDDSDGTFHKMAAAHGAAAYIISGRPSEYGRFLYEKIASSEGWDDGRRILMEPLYDAFAAVKEFEKSAGEGWIGPSMFLEMVTDKFGNIVPAAYSSLVGAGALTGAAAGALHWKMNRDIDEADPQTELAHTKARTYNRLTNEINNGLAMRGLHPSAGA